MYLGKESIESPQVRGTLWVGIVCEMVGDYSTNGNGKSRPEKLYLKYLHMSTVTSKLETAMRLLGEVQQALSLQEPAPPSDNSSKEDTKLVSEEV